VLGAMAAAVLCVAVTLALWKQQMLRAQRAAAS
jgi:hypothetical protein